MARRRAVRPERWQHFAHENLPAVHLKNYGIAVPLNGVECFEWDEAKASANLAKHAISFPDAVRVFDDLSRIEWLDDREHYGEARFVTIGLVEGREIVVVYTMRGENRRLIMARRATRVEREEYYGDREV
jgi:uncharacterized DUF497 family protein